MPVATIEGMNVTAAFDTSHSQSEMGNAWKGGHIHKVVPSKDIAYVIRPQRNDKPPALWLTGITMEFKGQVAVTTEPDYLVAEWNVGFIQTIYRCERNAHYATGTTRCLRLNTSFGPLTDGNSDVFPYYQDVATLKVGQTEVEDDDSPNFEMPLADQLGHPLESTSGRDEFSTFFALTRERDKSVVTLGRVTWHIDWTGTYTAATQIWQPKNADDFLTFNIDNSVYQYLDMKSKPLPTPFSLMTCEAENFAEIDTGGGWQPCSVSGDTSKPGIRTVGRWNQ